MVLDIFVKMYKKEKNVSIKERKNVSIKERYCQILRRK